MNFARHAGIFLRVMKLRHIHGAGGAILLAMTLAASAAGAAMYRSFSNDWKLHAWPPAEQYGGAIIVKFHNRSGLAATATSFQTLGTGARPGLAGLQSAWMRFRAGPPQPHFSRPAENLRAEHAEAVARVGQDLPDLTEFYTVAVPDHADALNLLAELRTNVLVEIAFAQPLPAPPPTIDLTGYQKYVQPPVSNGYDVLYARTRPGGNGAYVKLIDIEYDWYYGHEDIQKNASDIVWGTVYPNYGKDHGTAAMGISAALDNGFGMRGIVDRATIKMIAPMSGSSYVLANAINNAVTNTAPGDVILLEQQAVNGSTYCPVEYWADVYSAIVNAVALGRIVIEPAGNGSADLDAALWGGIFNRATRDSGAIIVGAGSSANRARASYSGFGGRVDVQGWGDGVASTGYGTLAGTVESNWYASGFNGTSSASALTAGIAASLQSHVRALYGVSLTPLELRSNLVANGRAQTFGLSGNIGPLPNLSNSYVAAENYMASDADGDGQPLWNERFAGTSPTNAASLLRLAAVARTSTSGGLLITWQSVTGKLYSVERATNLLAATPFALLYQHVPGQPGTTVRTDLTATARSPYLYRVRVEP